MPTSTVERVLRNAQSLLEENDCPTAIEELQRTIDEFPDEGRLLDLLGVALWDSGSVQESIDTLEQASMLVPLSPEAQLALGLGYEVAQKRELASNVLISLASRENLSPSILEQLARALGRANELSVALHVCERAAQLQPDSTAPLLGISYYMARLGASSRQILPVLFRALHLDPEDNSLRILLARRLHDCELCDEAAEVLRVVDSSSTTCPNCLYAMHEIFQAAGDTGRAAECYSLLANRDES